MYSIQKMLNGKFLCCCVIQDGTETWEENSKEEAISSLISAAYAYNGVRINRNMIKYLQERTQIHKLSEEDQKLIENINSGHLRVLEYDDFRLKSNLLEEEVKILYDIREGRAKVIYRH